MKTNQIPNEILHWSERVEYKEWKRKCRMELFENAVFTLLIIVIIALSFCIGLLVEKHFLIL